MENVRLEAVLGCFRRIVWAVECGSGTGRGREGARSGSSGGAEWRGVENGGSFVVAGGDWYKSGKWENRWGIGGKVRAVVGPRRARIGVGMKWG